MKKVNSVCQTPCIKTFPIKLLENIVLADKLFLDNFEMEYSKVVENIEKVIE